MWSCYSENSLKNRFLYSSMVASNGFWIDFPRIDSDPSKTALSRVDHSRFDSILTAGMLSKYYQINHDPLGTKHFSMGLGRSWRNLFKTHSNQPLNYTENDFWVHPPNNKVTRSIGEFFSHKTADFVTPYKFLPSRWWINFRSVWIFWTALPDIEPLVQSRFQLISCWSTGML